MKYYVGQKLVCLHNTNLRFLTPNKTYTITKQLDSISWSILDDDGPGKEGRWVDDTLKLYFMTEKEASERAFNTKFNDFLEKE